MIFLFGWGHQTRKEFGDTVPVECPRCHNQTYWRLMQVRTWFTLFFIPVIPYTSRHLLLCPVCSCGLELSADQIGLAKELNGATTRYRGKVISEEEYAGVLKANQLLA